MATTPDFTQCSSYSLLYSCYLNPHKFIVEKCTIKRLYFGKTFYFNLFFSTTHLKVGVFVMQLVECR